MAAKTVADVMKMVKENEVKFVDFRFTDTRGKEQHVTVPVSHFDEDKFSVGPCFRRLVDRRLEGHRSLRHAADAGPEHRQHRSVLRRDHAVPVLRRARAGRRQGLRPRPAFDRQARRGLPEGLRPGRHRLLRSGTRILHLRRRALGRRHVGLLRQDRRVRSALEHRQEDRRRQQGPPSHRQGRLLPRAPGRQHAGHARRNVADPRIAGHPGRSVPPRSGRRRPERDRHQVLARWSSAPTGPAA